jgi:hypothetical protein
LDEVTRTAFLEEATKHFETAKRTKQAILDIVDKRQQQGSRD